MEEPKNKEKDGKGRDIEVRRMRETNKTIKRG